MGTKEHTVEIHEKFIKCNTKINLLMLLLSMMMKCKFCERKLKLDKSISKKYMKRQEIINLLVLFSWMMMKCKICGRIFKPKFTMIEHILKIHGVFFSKYWNWKSYFRGWWWNARFVTWVLIISNIITKAKAARITFVDVDVE